MAKNSLAQFIWEEPLPTSLAECEPPRDEEVDGVLGKEWISEQPCFTQCCCYACACSKPFDVNCGAGQDCCGCIHGDTATVCCKWDLCCTSGCLKSSSAFFCLKCLLCTTTDAICGCPCLYSSGTMVGCCKWNETNCAGAVYSKSFFSTGYSSASCFQATDDFCYAYGHQMCCDTRCGLCNKKNTRVPCGVALCGCKLCGGVPVSP